MKKVVVIKKKPTNNSNSIEYNLLYDKYNAISLYENDMQVRYIKKIPIKKHKDAIILTKTYFNAASIDLLSFDPVKIKIKKHIFKLSKHINKLIKLFALIAKIEMKRILIKIISSSIIKTILYIKKQVKHINKKIKVNKNKFML